jgi:hypothetical protein
VTPLVITAFNAVLPTLFDYLSVWEDYLTPITKSRVDLGRSYLVKMAGIYVLLFGYIGIDQSNTLGAVRSHTNAHARTCTCTHTHVHTRAHTWMPKK